MSNYTIQVAWSGKDALADSDPAKVVSGDDFNTEFLAVQTAVNSKAELNGNSSEVFNVVTATAGDNTTKAATTAFVTTAVTNATTTQASVNGFAYPVGSVYTSIVATNPATLLGVGTWSAFGAGRVLVGLDASDTSFDVVEETGGAKTHSHPLSRDEMPPHNHPSGWYGPVTDTGGTGSSIASADSTLNSIITGDDGQGQAHTHDILQPYVVVYFWKRTA
tara:strand:- start:674 stop:1333 length:660 start_codon:yes stop_codon:yes gene_type:complete